MMQYILIVKGFVKFLLRQVPVYLEAKNKTKTVIQVYWHTGDRLKEP